MTLTTQAATLRAALMRQLVRLRSRPWERGPHVVYRDGALILDDGTPVTSELVARLATLEDGAGAERVREVMQ